MGRSVNVVILWGVLNAALAGVLLGFTLGRGAIFPVLLYAGAVLLIFGLAMLLWAARRRGPWQYRLRTRAHPGAAVALATAVAVFWLGLAFGGWVSMVAIVPLAVAVLLEAAARRG